MSAKPPKRTLMMVVAVVTVAMAMPAAADARKPDTRPVAHELTTFAAPGCVGGCGSGSTIGPDKALYVSDGPGGRVLRVDPKTGATTTYASGLPPAIPDVGIGGAIDVTFVGDTAYVLVTLVGPAFGQPDVVNGIYRIEKNRSTTVIADLGAWSIAHPPATDFFVPSGVQYALEKFRGGLLVTDGHHNRVLRVSRHGHIRELAAFGNIVPTGLEVHGRTILMGEAGPIPHLPENGKVARFTPRSPATEARLGGEPDRRRRVRSLPGAVRPLTRRLGSAADPGERGQAGRAGHRKAPARRRGTAASRRSSKAWTGRHRSSSSTTRRSSSRSPARCSGSTAWVACPTAPTSRRGSVTQGDQMDLFVIRHRSARATPEELHPGVARSDRGGRQACARPATPRPASTTSRSSRRQRAPGAFEPMTGILLIHGAWHGPWCWDGFAARLAERGHDVRTVRLRGHDQSGERIWHRIHHYLEDVQRAAERFAEPPVLVGHSMGGLARATVRAAPPGARRRSPGLASAR